VLGLPTDRPRGAEPACLSEAETFDLDQGLADAVRAAGGSRPVLLRAFAAVLARYTGSDEVIMLTDGAAVGRGAAAVTCDLTGNPSFAELSGRMRARPADDAGPSARVMFCTAAGDRTGMPLELACAVVERDAAITVTLEYDATLFHRSTIRRLGEHLQVLLADGLAHPERRVSRLELLARAERDLLLGAWSRNDRPLDLSHSIVELFDQQARRSPGAVAFVCAARTLTFADLQARSVAVAHGLLAGGVVSGDVVGVHMDRTLDYPVAMLGVLRAGAACLPLAADYPSEPLRWIVEDAGPAIVVTQRGAHDDFGDIPTRELGGLEHAGRAVADGNALPGVAELPQVTPDDLMYVIYTSGSTGRPKGVAVTHLVALNRLAWMWREHPFEAGEVCCQRTPANFVDSFWELFGPLLRGVPTVIVPARAGKDPIAYVELMAAHGVTRTWFVPTFLRAILDACPRLGDRLPRLRFWVSIGEALPAELLLRFERAMPHATLFNVYGASEIWDATCWDPSGHRDDLWRVPIGRPIDNIEVRVVDRNLELVPIGVPGELLVGGFGLARGYVGRPDLTAERFIDDPLPGAPAGSRLYRTGDLVRFLETGELEYIGRIDRQVQIWGCRVEPAEVEVLLLDHPAIADAVAMLDTSRPTPVLVAYTVARDGRDVREADIHAHMARVAPWYMRPAAFAALAAIPRTHSGKVDRLALPPIATAPALA
jgi:amino acid adenylation domain-containing protein